MYQAKEVQGIIELDCDGMISPQRHRETMHEGWMRTPGPTIESVHEGPSPASSSAGTDHVPTPFDMDDEQWRDIPVNDKRG